MTTTQNVTTHTVEVGHLDVAYFEAGSGEPLVLIHGGESDRNAFLNLLPHLGEGIRAIAYDQRDSGDTVNPDEPYEIIDLADDLIAMLDALEIDRANLLGVSFGSVVAMHAALEYPDRVSGVILAAGVPRAADVLERVREITAMNPDDRRDVMFDVLFTPEGLARNEHLSNRGKRALTDRPRELMERRLGAIARHDVIDRLSTMKVPALVIHGTDDPIAPIEMAELMATSIPDGELRAIPGGRHGISTEFADQVGAFVRSFLGLDVPGQADTHRGER